MKNLILCLCLLTLTACAQKPVAGPEEVNEHLNGIEMYEKLAGVLERVDEAPTTEIMA